MNNQKYEAVRLQLDEPELIDRVLYLFGKSTSYIDLKLNVNLDGSATLEIGTYIDEKEDVYPMNATGLKECRLTNEQLLKRLIEMRKEV